MSWQPRLWGAKDGRIIKKHLLTNCIGTLIVTTTLQIPSSIFTESYLSFLGMGVAVPLPSLGSLASDAINGMITFPYLLFAPCLLISLIILSFNLFVTDFVTHLTRSLRINGRSSEDG